MLTLEEALKMLDSMHDLARRDEELAERDDDTEMQQYWEGFGDALWTLRRHIETDVKVSCFPIGSCTCHPFKLERTSHPFWDRWRAWWNRVADADA